MQRDARCDVLAHYWPETVLAAPVQLILGLFVWRALVSSSAILVDRDR